MTYLPPIKPNSRHSKRRPGIFEFDYTVDNSSSSFDHESLLIGLEDTKSDWRAMVGSIKARPKGWMSRFSSEIDESIIIPRKLSAAEERKKRIQESGWVNTRMKVPNLPDPTRALAVETVSAFPDKTKKHWLCYACGLLTPLGSERAECVTCPVVGHLFCIPNVEQFIVLEKSSLESVSEVLMETSVIGGAKDLLTTPSIHMSHSGVINHSVIRKLDSKYKRMVQSRMELRRETSSFRLTPQTEPPDSDKLRSEVIKKQFTAKNLRWYCPFCVQDLKVTNDAKIDRYHREVSQVKRLAGCIKIQAFVRMVIERRRYQQLRHGIIQMQQVFRMRRLTILDILARANERYPFRIRLHDLRLFIPDKPQSKTPGEVVEPYFTPDEMFPVMEDSNFVGEIASTGYDRIFGCNKVANPQIEEKDQPLIQLLSAGHLDAPVYAKSFKAMQVVPKGSLFLTVSVHEAMNTETAMASEYAQARKFTNSQICRFDLPLKQTTKAVKVKSQLLQRLGYDLDQQTTQHLMNHFLVASYNTSKPYLLIPFSHANVDIRLTVSEVTDWPKSLVLGQSVYNLRYAISRKRTIALHQGVKQCSAKDIPSSEEGGKINLVMPRAHPNQVGEVFSAMHYVPMVASPAGSSGAQRYLMPLKHKSSDSHIPSISKALADQFIHAQLNASWMASKPQPKKQTPKGGRDNLVALLGAAKARAQSPESIPPSVSPLAVLSPFVSRPNTNHSTRSTSRKGTGVPRTRNSSEFKSSSLNADNRKLSSRAGRKASGHPGAGSSSSDVTILPRETSISGGVVTWSLLPVGFSDVNEFGYIMVLNQETITSTKRKCYGLLLERMFMIFSLAKDYVKLKLTTDIRTCYVSLLPDEVIRVKSSMDTIYIHCLNASDHEKWFRKLYSQSSSNSAQSYHSYMKRRQMRRQGSMQRSYQDITALLQQSQKGGRQKYFQTQTKQLEPVGVRRTSMQEVELLEFQTEEFLERMRREYIEYKATELVIATHHHDDDEDHQNLRNPDNGHSLLNALALAVIRSRKLF